jgi:pectate lyase
MIKKIIQKIENRLDKFLDIGQKSEYITIGFNQK